MQSTSETVSSLQLDIVITSSMITGVDNSNTNSSLQLNTFITWVMTVKHLQFWKIGISAAKIINNE